jgi:PAS domain S-box-containing protein/putative nucleotidyltransferase with HDIG domain
MGDQEETMLENRPSAHDQLEALLQAFPDLLFTVDENGVLLDYRGNNHVSTLFASAQALIGQKVADVLPRAFASRLEGALQELRTSEGPVSFEYRTTQGGATRWFETRLVQAPERQIVVVLRDASRHREAEEKIKSQLRRMAALRAIDLAISSSLDLHLALSVILSQVTAELAVDAADVLLLHPDGVLEFATGVGFRTEAMKNISLRIGQGYGGAVAANRERVHVADLRRGKTGILRSQLFLQEGFHSYFGEPLVSKGRVRGVLEVFHRRPITSDPDWLDFLESLAAEAAIAAENGLLLKELQKTNFELRLAYDTTIEGWSSALDLRDRDTEGHTQRVTYAAQKLARRLGMTDPEIEQVRRGAMLHDIGKMAIADSILLKKDALTMEEWEEMRRHPRYAYELLKPIDYLGPALDIPHYHHERWDGCGYPEGLKGEEIPMAARIFAIIDVFDALTSPRPYRQAWDKKLARAYILEQAGRHFDPEVASEFIRMLDSSHTGDLTVPPPGTVRGTA